MARMSFKGNCAAGANALYPWRKLRCVAVNDFKGQESCPDHFRLSGAAQGLVQLFAPRPPAQCEQNGPGAGYTPSSRSSKGVGAWQKRERDALHVITGSAKPA